MTSHFSETKRQSLKLAALFTAAGAAPFLSGLQKATAAELSTPLKIGYLPITDASPLLIAHQQEFWQKQGLIVDKPRLFRSWAQLVEAFLSGQVNFVHLLSPMAVYARYGSEFPAKVVAWNHTDGSAIAVAAGQGIDSIQDLAGKTIAIPFWYSVHNVVLQYLLRKEGLETIGSGEPSEQQVKLVVMAPADMLPALASSRIAGYIVAEPFVALSEVNKVGKVLRFTGDVWKEHACCVALMHQQDLELRPEWSQKVVNGLVEAQLWLRAKPTEAAQVLSRQGSGRYTPHDAEVLAKVLVPEPTAYEHYVSVDAIRNQKWQSKRIDFQPYPYTSYTELLIELLQQTYVEGDSHFLAKLDPQIAAADLVDDRWVKAAIALHGGMQAFGQPDGFSRTEMLGD